MLHNEVRCHHPTACKQRSRRNIPISINHMGDFHHTRWDCTRLHVQFLRKWHHQVSPPFLQIFSCPVSISRLEMSPQHNTAIARAPGPIPLGKATSKTFTAHRCRSANTSADESFVCGARKLAEGWCCCCAQRVRSLFPKRHSPISWLAELSLCILPSSRYRFALIEIPQLWYKICITERQ